MRRLNGKLFFFLLASVTVGGALVHGLHAFQVHRHSGMFLREAERAEKAGHFEESAENLRRYLLLSPSDTDVTARLAKLLFEHRQDRQAQLLYSQVLHQQPGHDEARRHLVDISLRLGAYQDAKYHLEKFLLKSHAEEGNLYLQLGSCQQALGDYIEAQSSFESAIKFAPELTPAYARLAALLVDRMDKGNQAKARLDEMIKRNPKSADAYLLRAAFLQAHASSTQVQAAFLPNANTMAAYERPTEILRRVLADAKRSLELAPNDGNAMLFAAQAAISCELPDEARAFAERALKINPAEPVAYVVLASNELRQNHQANAISTLKRGLEATKGNSLVLLTLANLELDAKDVEAAKPLIDQLRKIEAYAPVVRYFDTRVLISQAEWQEAAKRLHGASAELTRWPQFEKESQFWLAHCYARLQRNDLRIAAYRGALDIDPFWPPARMGLAEALREAGRIDESLLEYQRLLRLPNPNIPTRATVAGLQLAVAKNLSVPPEDGSWKALEKQVKAIAGRTSKENGLVLEAQVAVGENHLDDARQKLRDAIAAEPKNPTAWVNLLALELRSEHWSDAEKLLVDMNKQFRDGVPYRLARAEYLVRHSTTAKNELRSLAKAPASYSKDERLQLASGLARAALEIKDYEQAERLCRLVADNDPSNLQIRLVLFDLAQQAGQTKAMQSALKEVNAIEKDGFYFNYGQAVEWFLEGQQKKDEKLLDQALEKADEAKRLRPDWARATLLIAEINDYRGRRDAAIDAYTAAMDLGERDHRLLGRLVSLLYEQGSYSKAEAILKRLQDEKAPFSAELTRLASHTSIQTGDVNRAVDMARQTAAQSKDVRDHIWLGQVLSISGNADEAEGVLKKATQEAPKFPGGWIELIQLYKMTGKREQAEKVLAEAKTKIDVKATPLALGYACELLGQNADAEHYYADAMKTAPSDNRIRQAFVEFQIKIGKVNEADQILQQLIASSKESKDKATLQWSRRKRAGLLLNTRDPKKHAEAAELIGNNLEESPDSNADLRMKALLDASLGTKESRQSAIKQLESLSQRPGALAAEDRLTLAKLCWASGEESKARDQLRSLATQSRSPEYTLAYTEFLLDNKNEVSEAENWVRRLEELAPNDFGTVVTRARLQARQDHYGEAYESLTQFVKGDVKDGPAARTLRRRLAAGRFEEFGRQLEGSGRKQEADKFYAQAETWLPEIGADPARPTLLHVLFLIRRNRHNDAVAEIERMQQGKDMDALAKACLAMAQLSINEQNVLERATRVAEHVVSVRPTAESWIALGALQDRMANYDGAEQSYRKSLDLVSSRIDALNNLAYIMALRKKELPDARSLIERAMQSGGPRGPLFDSLAMIDLALGDVDAALSDAKQACSEDPNPVHLFHLARLQMTKGDRDAATAAFKKAGERGLTPAALHPLERSTLTELEAALASH